MTTKRIFVSGAVQGVGYRDWVVRTAQRGGVTGWVRNLRDGRVEILAAGSDDAIEALVAACREGPVRAQVAQVEAVAADDEKQPKGFTKRFTA